MIRVLIDNSAWARVERVPAGERTAELADAFDRGLIHVCMASLLEAGYSARGAHDHAHLLQLPYVAVDAVSERRALEAQGELARIGHHRVAPRDLVIASLADRHRLGVLHYDHDYDVIAERTSLRFESVWLAPAGSL